MYGMGSQRPPAGASNMGPSVLDRAQAGGPTSQNVPGPDTSPDAIDAKLQSCVDELGNAATMLKFEDAKWANQIMAHATKIDKVRIERKQQIASAQDLSQAQALINRMG